LEKQQKKILIASAPESDGGLLFRPGVCCEGALMFVWRMFIIEEIGEMSIVVAGGWGDV
jgi:hypothetical protein